MTPSKQGQEAISAYIRLTEEILRAFVNHFPTTEWVDAEQGFRLLMEKLGSFTNVENPAGPEGEP